MCLRGFLIPNGALKTNDRLHSIARVAAAVVLLSMPLVFFSFDVFNDTSGRDEMAWRTECAVRMREIGSGITRYKEATGRWPESLAQIGLDTEYCRMSAERLLNANGSLFSNASIQIETRKTPAEAPKRPEMALTNTPARYKTPKTRKTK